jgi:hypothetical protein
MKLPSFVGDQSLFNVGSILADPFLTDQSWPITAVLASAAGVAAGFVAP